MIVSPTIARGGWGKGFSECHEPGMVSASPQGWVLPASLTNLSPGPFAFRGSASIPGPVRKHS